MQLTPQIIGWVTLGVAVVSLVLSQIIKSGKLGSLPVSGQAMSGIMLAAGFLGGVGAALSQGVTSVTDLILAGLAGLGVGAVPTAVHHAVPAVGGDAKPGAQS